MSKPTKRECLELIYNRLREIDFTLQRIADAIERITDYPLAVKKQD